LSACQRALIHAKRLNLDECEVIFADRKITTVRITDSEIAEIKQNQEQNLGVRLIHKKRISSSQTRVIVDVEKTVEQAYSPYSLLKPRNFWESLPSESTTQRIDGLYDKKLEEIPGEKAIDIAQEMINSSTESKVTSISGSLNIVSEKIEIENSNGLACNDKATYISGMINAESDVGSIPVSGIGQESCRTLEKFFPEKVGNDAKNMCTGSINPVSCEADEYSIIVEPYSAGELLAFVFASNFNLKTFSEKKSCFSNKLNQSVAVENFNLIDDPHAPEGIGSKSFDDEGIATTQNHFIENGVFKNTYSDLYNAFKEDKKSSGNASRPGSPMGRDAEPFPYPAPHNLRIKVGDMSQDEMIQDTKHGLLVGRLWYTYAVNPIKGDFSCTARSGIRIIENGEIKNPGKSVRIIHNLPVMLQNISGIGNNQKNVLQWSSLPSITPSLRVEGIKVIPI
jgi:PmbA protein